MNSNKVLTEELLQQAAAELATARKDNLPPPDECQHTFSDAFEEKMKLLINGIGTTCYTVSIEASIIHK